MAREKNLKLDETTKLYLLNLIEKGEITEIKTLASLVNVSEYALHKALKRDKKFSEVFYNARDVYKSKKLSAYNEALDKIALGLKTKTVTEYFDASENLTGRTVVKKEFPPSFDALKYKLEKLETDTLAEGDGQIIIDFGNSENED